MKLAEEVSEKALFFRLNDALLRPLRGFRGQRDLDVVPETTLDTSVLERMRLTEYAPANLLSYLARHPEYDDQLEAASREAVFALRDAPRP